MKKLTINGSEYFGSDIVFDLRPSDSPISENAAVVQKAMAALSDKAAAGLGDVAVLNPDVKYLQGVFVTSGMNKNRDVFLPSQMLKSFATAIYKPINIEHVAEEKGSLLDTVRSKFPISNGTNAIVGVIYDAAFVHERTGRILLASDFVKNPNSNPFVGEDIDADFLEEQNKFHIIIAAALWKFIFPKTIADIVAKIGNGEMALSMESWVLDYDWLVDGQVLSREENPQYLSLYEQNLAVGGQKVGRVFRQIIWGAGGLVENPANPSAFDLIKISASTNDEAIQRLAACASFVETGTQINRGGDEGEQKITANKNKGEIHKMELEKLLETNSTLVREIASTGANLTTVSVKAAALEASEKELKAKLAAAEAELTSVKAEVTKLTASVASAAEYKEKMDKEKEDEMKEKAAKEEETKKLKAEVETLKTKAAEADIVKAELDQIKASVVIASRKAKLDEAGILLPTDEDKHIASLSDEAFAALETERLAIASVVTAKATASVGVPFLHNKGIPGAMRAVASVNQSGPSSNLTDLYAKI